MVHALIGLIVGLIMGLTGAGGALISIPLFISFLNLSLKEATVLSLVAVIFGTAVNLTGQFSRIDKKVVFSFAVFGGITNYLSLSLKAMTPESMIAFLLTLIGMYGIWGVWSGNKIAQAEAPQKIGILKLILTGCGLGLITTLTGLGGGVILVPVLIKFFNKDYENALPTSLSTILSISLISFLLQIKTGLSLVSIQELGLIAVGAVVSFLVLKKLLINLHPNKTALLRKITFTLVTVYSISTVLISTFGNK